MHAFVKKSLLMSLELMPHAARMSENYCTMVFVERVKGFMRREKSSIKSPYFQKITDSFLYF